MVIKRKQKPKPMKKNINSQALQHCFKAIKITINSCPRTKQQLNFPIASYELDIKGILFDVLIILNFTIHFKGKVEFIAKRK